jgi:hypothetical protein
MKKQQLKQQLTLIPLLLSFILGVVFVSVFSCLNPIGFNPELRIATESTVSGEIGIDNINSAELRFVNHTRSMDI